MKRKYLVPKRDVMVSKAAAFIVDTILKGL